MLMTEIELRECGLYAFPDERKFIVSASGGSGYSLFTPQSWARINSAEYRLDRNGRILSKGLPTRWRVTDRRDTGRTAEKGLLVSAR